MLLPNKTAHTHACVSHLFNAAGLWHADEEVIVTALLNKACEGLNEALTTGDRYRARLLLRLLAALTTTNVVSMLSMFSMLNSMVTAAMQALEQGEPSWPSLSHALLLCLFSALPCMLSSMQAILCRQNSANSACCVNNSVMQLSPTAPAVSLLAWCSYHTHPFVVVGDKAEASRRLQPYTDYLVYSAVIALPWLAPELQHLESDPEGLTTFSSSVEQYLSIRPRATQDALNPFPVANEDENAASLGGGGGASFLPQVCCT